MKVSTYYIFSSYIHRDTGFHCVFIRWCKCLNQSVITWKNKYKIFCTPHFMTFYDIFSAVALHNLVTSTRYGFSAKYPGLCERSVKPSLNEVHVRRCQIDDWVYKGQLILEAIFLGFSCPKKQNKFL